MDVDDVQLESDRLDFSVLVFAQCGDILAPRWCWCISTSDIVFCVIVVHVLHCYESNAHVQVYGKESKLVMGCVVSDPFL